MMEKSKLQHCCHKMDYYANPSFKKEHELVQYNAYSRSYDLIVHGYDVGMKQPIEYCPWCGAKLPQELGEEWCEVVKKTFKLDDVLDKEWVTLPEEFKTDEWWKKRGL